MTHVGIPLAARCFGLVQGQEQHVGTSPASCCATYWQVRILKYLLTVESEADRVQLLEQAFEPGARRGFSRIVAANWSYACILGLRSLALSRMHWLLAAAQCRAPAALPMDLPSC